MAIKLGSSDIAAAYLGSTSVSAIYLGSTQVWGGAPAVPIVETAPLYAEDFNTYPDNTSIIVANPTGPGWTAISGAGLTNAAKDNAHVISGAIAVRTTGSFGDNTSPGSYLLAAPVTLPDSNCFVQVRWKLAPAANRGVSLAAVDERSRIHVDLLSTVSIKKFDVSLGTAPTTVNSSAASGTGRYAGGVHGGWKSPVAGDLYTVRMFNNKVYVDINGSRILMNAVAAPGGSDVSAAPAPTGAKIGFATLNAAYHSFDDIKVGPLTGMLTIDNPERVYPRIQGLGGYANGASDIPFSGTYEGTLPTGLQWALFEPETGAVLKDWARVTSPTIGGGTWSATLRVPCGLNGRKGYRVGIRAENDTWNMVQSFGVNGVFYVAYTLLVVGQSNSGGITNANTAGVPDHPGGLWAAPADPPSTAKAARAYTTSWENSTAEGTISDRNVGRLTDSISTALNIPVYVSSVGIPSRSADQVGPNGGTDWTHITLHLGQQGGAFDAIYMSQGEAEINSGNNVPALAWKATWRDTNFPAYRALSGQPSGTVIPIFYTITGRNPTPGVTLSIAEANATILRQAQYELQSEVADCYLAHHYVGVTMSDGLHYTNNDTAGYYRVNQRLALTMLKVLASGTYDGRGPLAGTPTRAGAVITIPVNLNGAASLTALSGVDGSTAGSVSALTSWQVSTTSDFAAPLTISSAVLSGNNVVLTLAADPGGAVYVRNHAGYGPDTTSWVFGSYADGSSIGMEPVVKPIQTAS